ncbi:unnamed protein product [Rotaria sp. Silwood1]|nr:unnamed protein product [Rotaria sp. Silwood1]
MPEDGICVSATWDEHGVTVAGGFGRGTALNQLNSPWGLHVDDDDTIYVADTSNQRVVKWASGVSSGQVVVGGNGLGNHNKQLWGVTNLVVDKNGTMFMCDRFNKRVQRWYKNDNDGQTIIANISCSGVTMDNEGTLYVSDFEENSIMKMPSGQVVAGGNSRGAALNQFSYPISLFVDREKSIFVADYYNNRVMKWPIGAHEGIVVASDNKQASDENRFSRPVSVAFDQVGTIYVLDSFNHRVMRWFKEDGSVSVIVGGRGSGNETNQLSYPYHITFDRHGNLYVADTANHRVQMFAIDKSSCASVNSVLENVFCTLPSSIELIIQNIPTTFELNVPYTIILSSNNTSLLSYVTLDIEYIDTIFNINNDSFCLPTNESSSSYIYKTKFILKFEKNSTTTNCIQLKLHNYMNSTEMIITNMCTNNSTDKIFDNDDKYDVQSYMRTINTTEIALLDNFNWLIFGPHVREIWYTHEGMRLSRECDAAEDGRVAIFNNPRGKRRLISRPIDLSNVSLFYMRLGSGTCPPPAPTDPPFQLLITTDCLNYSNWLVVYSQQILPGIEHVTVPLSLNNITNSSTVCLKIEQDGDKFVGSGSWFIDDLLITRFRLQNEYFFETFKTMRLTNWYRLVGGHLKTCDGRMSMVFESHVDIRTDIGATTIDFSLSGMIDYERDALFYLSKNSSIDWTKWNATGFLDLNKTCNDEDVITFNEENYRQLCSPIIEISRIDNVRFTLSTEPCMKRNKYTSTSAAVIFLSIFYNVSTATYSRTIRRISLRDIPQTHKTFHVRFDELRHSTTSFGRICLSQYPQSSGKNVDVWSIKDFVALPLLQSNITHYIQLGLNTKCNLQEQLTNGLAGISNQNINIEYSIDLGKTWHFLLQPCFRGSTCSHDARHINDELLLPFIDSTDLSAIHFQTIARTIIKNNLLFECSPNGGVKWFELGVWTGEKDNSLKDHYVSLSSSCQAKHTLFRWKNSSIQLLNVAFVKSYIQHYFMDEFKKIDSSKWLYPTYSINSSGLYTNKINHISNNKTIFQLISTAITLKQHNYVIMIDTDSNMNNTRLQVDYSLDNITWHELIDTKNFERQINRFGRQIPLNILRRSILIRIQSDRLFTLNHIYIGPSCPANCYGHGKCLWKTEQAICQCDNNQTSETNCLQKNLLLSSLYETFENKLNSSIWSISSHVQLTHRCYNRQSKTTPYLCFLPNNYTHQNYAIIGPFKALKYVLFKFGLQYVSLTNCSNQILFQYSYDNGIQWYTKKILDETNNIFERFDDLLINMNIYLRWIEENDQSCLMWNLRSISIRTKNDENLWFENNLHIEQKNEINYDAQTWEFPLIQSSSIIQFDLQMFPLKKTNNTNWYLILEISSNIIHGWSHWISLIPSCNQTNLYCEDKIASTGSLFLAQLYQQQRNVTIPIPDSYVNQEVRFRWTTSQSNARFMINKVYVGADCPWFCSGHGLCQSNGCQCNHGYVLPFCSPDPLTVLQGEILPMQLNANLSSWSEVWGYEKCSLDDERYVFSKADTRGLISREFSLVGIKFIRIELDTCFNRTEAFIDPIHVQISSNNGILWKTLMTIKYRQESPHKPWLIELPKDEAIKLYLVRIRLFQRVTTKWTSIWILNKFEMIPQKLSNQFVNNGSSVTNLCNYKNHIFPLELYSTIDIELNETSFLTFQLDSNRCMSGSSVTPSHLQFDLEFSIDYGQTWSFIDLPATIASSTNDIIITQPLRAIKNMFFLPLYAYRSLSKFIRIRWLAANSTIATRWQITNITIRPECEVLCELDSCNGKCRCSERNNCLLSSRKATYFERFNNSLSDLIVLPSLNLISTRFIEFTIHMNCQQNIQIISLEYSRNMGLSWQLFKYIVLSVNQSYIIHEDLLDEMRYDYVHIRFIFLSNISNCLKLEQIIVSGSIILQEMIYGKFDQLKNFNPRLFVSLGDGIFNGTYLIFPTINKSNLTINEIITDDLNIFENSFYIQLAIVPLSLNRCINILFSFSSDYGYTWQSIDYNEILLFDEGHTRRVKIFTWELTSMMIGSNQVRFRIDFNDEQISSNEEQFFIGISELYIGSNCINACNGHGMCSSNGRCKCDSNWTNTDCSRSLIRFPNELNILKHVYYTSYGTTYNSTCGTIFNNTCKREFETNYMDINHEHTYVHIELDDRCMSKTYIRKNGDGWIRLQYRQINLHQWNTLHIFKDHQLNIIKLLPQYILQLRLIQNSPIIGRPPWSIEQFHIFHIHSHLQWFSLEDKNYTKWNSTFLKILNTTNQIIYETKDVYFNSDYILQIEFNSIDYINNILEYSINFGLTWFEISNENELEIIPIKFNHENITFYRLTVPFYFFSIQNNSIRFRFKFSSNCTTNNLQYIYIGNKCLMNCYGNTRCINGECQVMNAITPLVDFRETFEKDFNPTNWLQLELYRHEINRILWTTTNRQAITRPIDLRPMRAIKWTYNLENISKTCNASIYLLISTDGTLTWSILHRFDIPIKNITTLNTSIELFVELKILNTKYHVGQFRWFQPLSSKCNNFTWGLSKIISIKSINIDFITDYFYAISSARSNWESIDGALFAQPDQCNNNIPALIFHETSFSVITVPILIQQFHVLVLQFNTKCDQNVNMKTLQCRNLTTIIEYRTDLSLKWTKLINMEDLACRTSLINGGYFNMHTIKLPFETYSRYDG